MKRNQISSLGLPKPILLIGLIAFVSPLYANPLDYSLGNVFGTATNVTGGILQKLPKFIPTPDEVFNSGKDLFLGYPFEVVFDAINKVCSSVNSVGAIKSKVEPDIRNMTFKLITKCQNYTFPIKKADEMWKSPHFDKSQKTVIVVSGWSTDIESSFTLAEISKAYLCRGGFNIVALDAGQYVNTLYTWSALNVEEIGEILGDGLVELRKIVPLENIHVIGHSLGANIAGYAGTRFTNITDELIPRITALDPARPCFNEGEKLSGIQRGDAEFIDVIHTCPGVLGKRDPVGDVDYYPGGLGPLQRGCYSIACSHSRAIQYYAESVYPGHEDDFTAIRCSSLSNVKMDLCIGKPQRMGFGVSMKLKGSFFSDTQSEFPFGPTPTEQPVDVTKCGLCDGADKIKPEVKF